MQESDRYTDERRERFGDDGEERGELPAFLLDPLGVLKRRWRWMLLALLIGLAASAAAVSRVKPLFAATAKVLIASQQIPEEFVRSTVVEDSFANINAMIGRTISLDNLQRLIQVHGLYAEEINEVPLIDLIDRMRERIEIGPAKDYDKRGGSLIFEIRFEDENAEKTAAVANALTGLMIEASIERRNAQARQTTEFLRRALAQDQGELEAQSRLVSDYRMEHRGTLPEELETNLRRLELLSERRQSFLAQIGAKENQIATISATDASEPSESEALLEELRRQLARETAINTDVHPNVIALRERIARLEEAVEEERRFEQADPKVQRLVESEQRSLDLIKSQLAAVEAEIATLDARVDQAPKIGEELAALERKEQVLRERYLDSLRKVQEAEMAESLESAQQGSRVSVLDPAQRPTKPQRNRLKYLLAGLVLSFGVATGSAVLLELIDPVVVNARQMEAIAARPALGIVPHMT